MPGTAFSLSLGSLLRVSQHMDVLLSRRRVTLILSPVFLVYSVILMFIFLGVNNGIGFMF